jgi:hypothetical protein
MANIMNPFPGADELAATSASTLSTDALLNNIRASETNNIYDSLLMADNTSSSALTYSMYLSRNKTISNISSDLTKQNLSIDDGASDTYKRQSFINEWQAQNKLDTLFFLQCMFLYLTSIIGILFLRRNLAIAGSTMYWLIVSLTVVLIGILYNRANYTRVDRDKTYWNRRFLHESGVPEPKATCATDATSSVIPGSVGSGASGGLGGAPITSQYNIADADYSSEAALAAAVSASNNQGAEAT